MTDAKLMRIGMLVGFLVGVVAQYFISNLLKSHEFPKYPNLIKSSPSPSIPSRAVLFFAPGGVVIMFTFLGIAFAGLFIMIRDLMLKNLKLSKMDSRK